jgi:nucleoside-diphosphate-sugar epimerase
MADSFIMKSQVGPEDATERRCVLVTGAAGRIGSYFAEQACEKYDLRLQVRLEEQKADVESFGRVECAELADLERLKTLCEGVDTVVHLAAISSPRGTWDELHESNIVGTYNLFVAARTAGCRRVVFASSIHAVSGYPHDRQVQADDPVSPGDLYGVSKCFGEAMGRFMATQHGLSVICIRIGGFHSVDWAQQADAVPLMNAFVSRRDLDQLINRCIDDEQLQFAILHGLSNNRFNRMDIREARELVGYAPQDDFTEVNAELADLDLSEQVRPHSETGHDNPTGIRNELD